jgi:hypothetical protein
MQSDPFLSHNDGSNVEGRSRLDNSVNWVREEYFDAFALKHFGNGLGYVQLGLSSD